MSTQFNYERHKAFGWVVHRKALAAGERYSITVTADTAGAQIGNITLWTKGRIEGTDRSGQVQIAPRVPGYNNLNRGIAPAGSYDYVATEPSEWWCINYVANRNTLPSVEIFSAAAGEVKALPVGTKLLLCVGSVSFGETQHDAPAAFEISSQQATFVAGEQCYGFIFAEESA
jgi:hypothetical protein